MLSGCLSCGTLSSRSEGTRWPCLNPCPAKAWECLRSPQPPAEGNPGARPRPRSLGAPAAPQGGRWVLHGAPLLPPSDTAEAYADVWRGNAGKTAFRGKHGCCEIWMFHRKLIFFHEKHWNVIIHFIVNVKAFFAAYWALTMASGALWSRSSYPLRLLESFLARLYLPWFTGDTPY